MFTLVLADFDERETVNDADWVSLSLSRCVCLLLRWVGVEGKRMHLPKT